MSRKSGSENRIKYVLFESENRFKYILVVFYLMFMITGIALITTGNNVSAIFTEFDIFLVSKLSWIPILLIIVGLMVIAISIFGFWGSLKESYIFIMILAILFAQISALELAAGICGYVFKSNIDSLIMDPLKDSMKQYSSSHWNYETAYWDNLQKTFSCCGFDYYRDWAPYFGNDLPLSCCSLPSGTVGNFSCTAGFNAPNVYINGCFQEFSWYIIYQAELLGETGIIIGVLQWFGVMCTCYIARKIRIRNEMMECIS